jgi:hypothetical protein
MTLCSQTEQVLHGLIELSRDLPSATTSLARASSSLSSGIIEQRTRRAAARAAVSDVVMRAVDAGAVVTRECLAAGELSVRVHDRTEEARARTQH